MELPYIEALKERSKMPNEYGLDEELETFDISRVRGATAHWPRENKKVRAEEISHPNTIPDLREGPFQPLEDRTEEKKKEDPWPSMEGAGTEEYTEIDYEGER